MAEKNRQEPPATLGEAWNHGVQIGLELNVAKARLRETVAHRIKNLRLEAKLTQEELANQINTNFLTYRGYENCKSDIPLALLIRVADVFDVSLDYLTGRTDERRPESKQQETESVEKRIAQLEKIVAALTEK